MVQEYCLMHMSIPSVYGVLLGTVDGGGSERAGRGSLFVPTPEELAVS